MYTWGCASGGDIHLKMYTGREDVHLGIEAEGAKRHLEIYTCKADIHVGMYTW